jgi:predicted ABC-type ATPase
MKKILIIAGPNGAGKTTFAEELLPNEAGCPEFVNADLIAAGLSPFQPDQAAFAAGRLMLRRIADLVAAGKSFAFETTLSSRANFFLIPVWKKAGYVVKLYFLKLPDAEFAIHRVAQRVFLGGHNIPTETIRRRHRRGWVNLQAAYIRIVDEWAIYDASRTPPLLMDTGENHPPGKLMEDITPYRTDPSRTTPVKPLDDPDFIGAEAALRRASAKAIAKARAAGLEPIVSNPEDLPAKLQNSPSKSSLITDH